MKSGWGFLSRKMLRDKINEQIKLVFQECIGHLGNTHQNSAFPKIQQTYGRLALWGEENTALLAFFFSIAEQKESTV